MNRDPRFDLLFESVRIGPKIAPNRFYQVPHCSGMGFARPKTHAAMRAMKAEGGWGVVCTEYCSIDPSSDDAPHPYGTLWDDQDIRNYAIMTEGVHKHGALAGVELWAAGDWSSNLNSRLPPVSLSSNRVVRGEPVQTRPMDRADIRALRRMHVDAAKRAVIAGFDIVYVYAAHDYLLHSFLRRQNPRTDEYGGSVENRVRLVRELLSDVKDAVGHKSAVALRWSIDGEEPGIDGIDPERLEMTSCLDGLPDLWDVVIEDYTVEMGASRYTKEAALEGRVSALRTVATGPVVTVGRYTSPESMLRLIKSGVADFIGAARPSIADPFLPKKIADGRLDDIRECIGCNLCYAHNSLDAPLRCTQNPTMGEEWRRGWHPEIIPPAEVPSRVLVVGGGPAGLEAARALGQRGYDVSLAEKSRRLGGRLNSESTLPGFSEWARVRDWRETQIGKLDNVSVYLESEMTPESVLEFGADHVVIATGSQWRRDAHSRDARLPPLTGEEAGLFSPEEIMAGSKPSGIVAVYDDDGYYLASALAQKLIAAGASVLYITPSTMVSPWSFHTNEQHVTQARLIESGARLLLGQSLVGFADGELSLSCIYTGRLQKVAVNALVPVTMRNPGRGLYDRLSEMEAQWRDFGINSVNLIGDAEAPGTIAHAVYAGHRIARELDEPTRDNTGRAAAPIRERVLV